MPDPVSLEAKLNVTFRDRGLLDLALVHSSFLNENPGAAAESNERLEYLGDAVLGLSVAEWLYEKHPEWPEGDLTRARAEVVRGDTLALVAAQLGLGEYLRMGKGEAAGGGRERPTNLAATLEALIGAVLMDQGYDAARRVAIDTLSEPIESVARSAIPANPKSALLELAQGRGLSPPVYAIVEAAGEPHARTFTAEVSVDGEIEGRGAGSRKADAEQAAARAALEAIQNSQ